jgi:hypothetical protein
VVVVAVEVVLWLESYTKTDRGWVTVWVLRSCCIRTGVRRVGVEVKMEMVRLVVKVVTGDVVKVVRMEKERSKRPMTVMVMVLVVRTMAVVVVLPNTSIHESINE